MREKTCPRCGASRVVQRMVNNRFRASDPAGQVFEVTLQEPIWSCPACQMGWEGEDTLAAKENAYQAALTRREAKSAPPPQPSPPRGEREKESSSGRGSFHKLKDRTAALQSRSASEAR